jgi:hypothetical protein
MGRGLESLIGRLMIENHTGGLDNFGRLSTM